MSPRSLIAVAGLAAAGLCAARRLVAYEIAEASMTPTLHPGDWVIGIARPPTIRRGDVVVAEHPDRPGFDLVKRVVAVTGDAPMPGMAPLGPGLVWLEGDGTHEGSVDSRRLGAIDRTAIRARIVARYHPRPARIGRGHAPEITLR